MHTFDYIKTPATLLTPEIVQKLTNIHEHKGKQELFIAANTNALNTLMNVAKIQSTGASNRIERICTSDQRVWKRWSMERRLPRTDLSRKS